MANPKQSMAPDESNSKQGEIFVAIYIWWEDWDIIAICDTFEKAQEAVSHYDVPIGRQVQIQRRLLNKISESLETWLFERDGKTPWKRCYD